MDQFGVMIGQLVGFFIMLMVGYGCVRLRFYGKVALDGMCSLLLNVLIPVLVFSNAVDGTDRSHLAANWGVMLLTAVMYGLLVLVFWALAHVLRLKGSRSHIFQASLIFGNAGFIGIPLIMALFPKEGAIYVALMSIVDQALLWTYGVWLCEPVKESNDATATQSAESVAAVGARKASRPSIGSKVISLLRRFINPAFIGVMIALALILLGVKVPAIILKPLHTIGNMATPMSLIYLGGLFALTRWWKVLQRYELYVGLVAKMIAFPLAFYALLTAVVTALPFAVPITHDMMLMITVISGLPTMTTIAMFTGRKDNMPEYAVGFVLVSTLFSLCSLAVVSAVVF
ncbi:transporter, auxin efflux carrier family [Bifidobacterium saguini DSM 23967]|uniref:AEC family transporter n=3 Tax=Bifidobacterium TaxID=1678 RepID=A0A2N5ITL9_9BIFI|nr:MULTISPECIES: AEC family transporter [Bifidobacterium]KFI94094.1 transporter, auxin efflux carrier family [Bifidobacterium saguini DSM 23967]PLS25313.1 permease [Bifidobacterium imperatoris]QSY57926.1 AEC family transporter [Bifidobacterium imperatoris]QTB90398.1 AEC family transporter [Bifidobacterium saguini]